MHRVVLEPQFVIRDKNVNTELATDRRSLDFSTEDMAFEFKKAFQKATELRSLTFAQQWTMTDDSVFNSEQPVMASGLFIK